MARWTKTLARWGSVLERGLDEASHALSSRFEGDELVVMPYTGYGTDTRFYLRGRVLDHNAVTPAGESDSVWQNLANAYKRFATDEVRGARVAVCFGERREVVETDEEGHFAFWFELDPPLPPQHEMVQELGFELLSPHRPRQKHFLFHGDVVVPSPASEFGIISDMDDTVLQTGATSVLSMAKKVLLGNARTRLPFEGVAAFYEALSRDINPIFYVSSSPWNLYDVLVEFLALNDIPLGPLTLRDWGLSPDELLPTGHGTHKLEAIEHIMNTYPSFPFILIGDSGQEDPEIYHQVVHNHPGRILAVYIRDVNRTPARTQAIAGLADEVVRAGSQLVLVQETPEAAAHAAAQGWIATVDIDQVEEAKREDEEKPKL